MSDHHFTHHALSRFRERFGGDAPAARTALGEARPLGRRERERLALQDYGAVLLVHDRLGAVFVVHGGRVVVTVYPIHYARARPALERQGRCSRNHRKRGRRTS